MISVVIPLMPIKPYSTQVTKCQESILKQSAETEIIVVVQETSRYINKNRLLNNGVEKSTGGHVFFCDADFTFPDRTLLERMSEKDVDVIFPMFRSKRYGKLKISDGGAFMDRDTIKRFGQLDESLQGISWVTFPFLKWCLDNARWHCSDEFTITVGQDYVSKKKRHGATSARMRPTFKSVVKRLQIEGVWP